ncbi:MAG: sulfatase [Planctomycetota bacterium]
MKTSRNLLRIALGIALLGFLVGTLDAVWEIFGSASVREFQAAGDASPLEERLTSLAHRAAIEGVGFLGIGLVVAVTALGLARLMGRDERQAGERLGAAILLSAAAFIGWAQFGAYVGNEALPFLAPGHVWLLNLVGYLAIVAGLALYYAIGRSSPWAGSTRPLSTAIAALATAAGGGYIGAGILRAAPDGWLSAWPLFQVAGLALVGLALVGPLARRITALDDWIVRWWSRPAPVPKGIVVGVSAALVLSVAIVAPVFTLSSLSGPIRYKTLANPSMPAGPNVVLVTIDTLRAMSLGTYGYQRPTSPFLDRLAREGTVMLDATAPAAWTKPTTGTILTGLYPSRHGALEHGSPLRTPEGMKTLAETFRDAGYVTAGFVTNPNIKAVFDFDRGFEEYFDSPVEDTVTLASIRNSIFGKWLMNLSRHQFNWKYENDVMKMNEHIFTWLEKNRSARFFLYLHYIDPHAPYSPPNEYYEMFRRDAGARLFNARKELVGLDLYDGEIRYTDDGMKALVAKFRELGLWENTVFVLTSDHGEEWFEHGVLGHGFSLYQPVVGVPLIFHGPGVPSGARIETPVGIVDMPATVLDLAEVGQTELGDGTSFRPLFRGEGAGRSLHLENEFGMEHNESQSFIFNGLREGPYKLILTKANKYFPPSDPRYKDNATALYDVISDPGERVNLIAQPEHAERVERMLDQVLGHQSFLNAEGLRDGSAVEMSADTQEQLRALGYLGNH